MVVYPAHGVGQIIGTETQEIDGLKLKLFVVNFDNERLTLRVPCVRARTSGLRHLANKKDMQSAMERLQRKARVRRTMWSRRAQEYEGKINSGDPVLIAEVVRELFRNANQPDQSYSERQIYETAMERLVREFAAVEKTSLEKAEAKLKEILEKAA